MSLLPKCKECEREEVGGDGQTGVCHRCRDSVLSEKSKTKGEKVEEKKSDKK